MTKGLKLAAADAEDLEMLSARLQDAAGKLKDFVWLPKQRRFAAMLNRFRWEDAGGKERACAPACTSMACSRFSPHKVKRGAAEAVVSLLAIRFTPQWRRRSGGVIELVLAGGGTIRLTVECIDAELADLTGPWAARARPATRIAR